MGAAELQAAVTAKTPAIKIPRIKIVSFFIAILLAYRLPPFGLLNEAFADIYVQGAKVLQTLLTSIW